MAKTKNKVCCPFRSLRTAIFRFSCHARLHVFRWFSGFDWFWVTIDICKTLCPEIQSYLTHTQCFSCIYCYYYLAVLISMSLLLLAAGRGAGGRVGGVTPLYKPYMFVPPQRVAPFRSVCRPFWSRIGYGIRGNNGSVWRYLSFQFQMNKKRREICQFETDLKKSFC